MELQPVACASCYHDRRPSSPDADELPRSKKTQLALAIAQGESVAAWARGNDVPRQHGLPVGQRAQCPGRRSKSCRRRALDRAIGRMATRATWAVDQIAKLAASCRVRVGSAQGAASRLCPT